MIKEGKQLIHTKEGNARARKVMRAPGGSMGERRSEVSRCRTHNSHSYPIGAASFPGGGDSQSLPSSPTSPLL